jgi:hypothetical protein
MDSPLPLPVVLVGLLPALIPVVRGLQAHVPPRKLVGVAIPKTWFTFILLAVVLPSGSLGARAGIAVGVLLAALDVWMETPATVATGRRKPPPARSMIALSDSHGQRIRNVAA